MSSLPMTKKSASKQPSWHKPWSYRQNDLGSLGIGTQMHWSTSLPKAISKPFDKKAITKLCRQDRVHQKL